MTNLSAGTLAETYRSDSEADVLDVKFLLSNREEVSFEEARAELAVLNEAIEKKRYEPLKFGDLSWK